ncbi:MbtH family NRPS accessory protein [Kitasatospora sp. NPDC127111]
MTDPFATDPFEDATARYLVLANRTGHHSFRPGAPEPPAG